MPSIGDFHLHSTFSDGTLAPAELLDLAVRNGVRYLALTDHDSTEGLPAMRAALGGHPGVVLVAGVELSCDIPGDEVHVLGYFLDEHDTHVQERLRRLRDGRVRRAERMVEKLNALGLPITWERVLQIANGAAVGRPHIAQALLESDAIATLNEAFERYIGRNGPAYVERDRMLPAEAVRFIREAGGVTSLAHPSYVRQLATVLPEMVEAGLDGIEVYYKQYDGDQISHFKTLADRYRLVATGGSDYHGLPRGDEREPGDIPFPDLAVHRFVELGERAVARAGR